jgi:anaerobic selenocysteine-containing dehydrogenase
MMADLILPDSTYLERLQDIPTYPFRGWPLAGLRQPAVKTLYDTKAYGDILIEIGKRMKGPMGEYHKSLKDTENVLRHLAKGFEKDPGDNGVNGFESWKKKGVWYKKPYLWRQHRGKFYEWDGTGYTKLMTAEQVKKKLLKTPSGKFELKSGYLEKNASYINKTLKIPEHRVGFPQWVEPRYTGGGDLHFITPKLALHAEGRSGNLPQTITQMQPAVGGNTTVYLEIHPDTARARGIRNDSKVRIKSSVGTIEAYARYYGGTHPGTVVLPMEHGHWAMGRWARDRIPGPSGEVIANVSDPISGLATNHAATVSVTPA